VQPPGEDFVLVGVVARTHGLRGDVIVNPETDFPDERFAVGARLVATLGGAPATLTIVEARVHQGRPLVRFEGYSTCDEARSLAQQPLWIREQDRAPLPAGWFYHADLVGCIVETADGTRVGTVSRVDELGGGPLLAVGEEPRVVLIPLVDPICRVLDPPNRRIVIDPPEGLLDLNR
jgi:16S rRNA processing protein RimM